MTATWTFASPFIADHLLITLSDAIVDVEGESLDGEWVNPSSVTTINSLVSTFPSGNGVAGGRFEFVFNSLFGDANGSGGVDLSDLSILSNNYGMTSGASYSQGDFDGDGDVDVSDFSVLSSNYGKDLIDLVMASDFNNDYRVGSSDLSILSANYGQSVTQREDGDANEDGIVDLLDLSILSNQWGLGFDAVS
jgi:hypothetical protein